MQLKTDVNLKSVFIIHIRFLLIQKRGIKKCEKYKKERGEEKQVKKNIKEFFSMKKKIRV